MNRRAYLYRIAAILLLVAVPQLQGALTPHDEHDVSLDFFRDDRLQQLHRCRTGGQDLRANIKRSLR